MNRYQKEENKFADTSVEIELLPTYQGVGKNPREIDFGRVIREII